MIIKKLTLDRNLIGSDEALIALGTTPYLKELSLELNRIERIPAAAVENGGFGEVEVLNLAQNAVAHEDSLVPVLQMPRLRTLSVWGNPFVGRSVPQAFDEVLSDRAVGLVVSKPEPPLKQPAYEHASVLGLDAVVNAHRAGELVMRSAARPQPPGPTKRENLHVAQARANLAQEALEREAARQREAAEVQSGGFFVTQDAEVRPLERRERPARAHALNVRELQDALLISDEAESLIDSNIDVRTAINALKYALEHPLVEYDGDRPTHHQKTTATYEASKRNKFVRPRDPLNIGTRGAEGDRGEGYSGDLARQTALERGIDTVPAKLDALRRKFKVAEVGVSEQGIADLQTMLSALQKHDGGNA